MYKYWGESKQQQKKTEEKAQPPAAVAAESEAESQWKDIDEYAREAEASFEEIAQFWGTGRHVSHEPAVPASYTDSFNGKLTGSHGVPSFKGPPSRQRHRNKIQNDLPPMYACVARPVSKKEMLGNEACTAAMKKEWDKLFSKGTFDLSSVREWSQVAADANAKGKTVHMGRVFGIMV